MAESCYKAVVFSRWLMAAGNQQKQRTEKKAYHRQVNGVEIAWLNSLIIHRTDINSLKAKSAEPFNLQAHFHSYFMEPLAGGNTNKGMSIHCFSCSFSN